MHFILNTEQIREADRQTMEILGISSVQLMEKAATAWTEAFLKHVENKNQRIHLFCGPGNNGGDGLVVARLLHRLGFRNIHVFIPNISGKYSDDHRINFNRLKELEQQIQILISALPDSKIEDHVDAIAVDALFGSGLHSILNSEWEPWISYINKHRQIFSVDIPSGFFSDMPTPEHALMVENAHVITFESIKKMFLFPESEICVKSWEVVQIGWPWEKLIPGEVHEYVITKKWVNELLKPRKRFSHKGTNGRCLVIAGSGKYPGAAVLCAGGAIRSGAGLTFLHSTDSVCQLALYHFPELIVNYDENPQKFIQSFPKGDFDAVAIGPGLSDFSDAVLKTAIHSGIQLVLDADALNRLSKNPTWLHFLPKNTIITPHPGEFDRLFGKQYNHFERWIKAKEMSKKLGIIIVLKSTHTVICTPEGNSFFNIKGNSGMAKGGSGDVLTGIIASLLAQGNTPLHAAVIGVYLHSLAADLALKDQSMESLCATDIIRNIGKAFQFIRE
jgi:NAD(P)H-hydrate epimerase